MIGMFIQQAVDVLKWFMVIILIIWGMGDWNIHMKTI